MQPRRKTAIWSNDAEAVASGRGQPGAQQQVGMGAHGTRHTARAKSCTALKRRAGHGTGTQAFGCNMRLCMCVLGMQVAAQ